MSYSKRTFEGNLVLLDVLNGGVGDGGLAVLEDRGDIARFPSNGGLRNCIRVRHELLEAYRAKCASFVEGIVIANLGGDENVLDSDGNLGTNTVTLDQADEVVALENALLAFYLDVLSL